MPTTKMKEQEFYCVKDRKRVIIPTKDICFKNIKNSKMPSGKTPALVAYCHSYDCNLTKFVGLSKVETLKKI